MPRSIPQQQYDSYTYTPEQIAASYAEKKDSYDTFSYQYYFVQADTEDTTDDDGNTLCQDHGRHDGGRQGHGRQDRRCHA